MKLVDLKTILQLTRASIEFIIIKTNEVNTQNIF